MDELAKVVPRRPLPAEAVASGLGELVERRLELGEDLVRTLGGLCGRHDTDVGGHHGGLELLGDVGDGALVHVLFLFGVASGKKPLAELQEFLAELAAEALRGRDGVPCLDVVLHELEALDELVALGTEHELYGGAFA